ncbi:creatininase family protein [Salinirubellus salinus]|uniref:Creatininase family protein n=1 Tax=Salinirubellus salinus TaxID=1364945 RepID=A0A9E7R1E9_9EURY|nr:creatininase family protein [Salinirubellus salinus]UWM53909.1 creatininase family protein [Salinirubellus salinus]
MHLAANSWTDARDADTDLAILPVGSTEQHGPHAPLGVDFMTAEAIAAQAAQSYDDEVVVAPSVPVGIAEEHRAFDGTLWVTEDSFRDYVGDVLRSLAHSGFDRVVVVNGHGGNTDALAEICMRVSRDGDCYAVPFTWFDVVDSELPLGHGGPVETSVMLAIAPQLIQQDRYPEAAEGAGDSFGEFVAGANLAYDFDEFSGSGNLQDPTPASVSEGERLLEAAAESCVELLEAVAERER